MHVQGGVGATKVVQGRPDGARRGQRFHQGRADRTCVPSRGAAARSLTCLEHDHLGPRGMQEPGARKSDDAAAHNDDRTVEQGWFERQRALPSSLEAPYAQVAEPAMERLLRSRP